MKKLLLLLMFTTLMSLTSCGAKKTASSETSEKTKAELKEVVKENLITENNVKESQTVTDNSEDNTITKKTTYAPIDPTKPASVKDEKGTVHDLNNASLTEEETVSKSSDNKTANTNTVMDNKTSENKQIDLAEKQEGEKKAEAATTDRKQWEFSWWWLLAPISIVILVYISWRKYKNIQNLV